MDINLALGRENASGMFFHADLTDNPAFPSGSSPVATVVAASGSAWKNGGAISEDGPSWTPFGSTERIRLWDLSVARAVETEKGSMTIPVITTNADSMKTVFGADAVQTVTNGFIVDASNGMKNKEEAFILWGRDGNDDLCWMCPRGIVTEVGEVGLTPTGAMIWNITITGGWKFMKTTLSGASSGT